MNEINQGRRPRDIDIWKFAKTNGYTILTFDEDFSELQNLRSFPPKIIWLRTGNINTKEIASILLQFSEQLEVFLENEELGIYEIYLAPFI